MFAIGIYRDWDDPSRRCWYSNRLCEIVFAKERRGQLSLAMATGALNRRTSPSLLPIHRRKLKKQSIRDKLKDRLASRYLSKRRLLLYCAALCLLYYIFRPSASLKTAELAEHMQETASFALGHEEEKPTAIMQDIETSVTSHVADRPQHVPLPLGQPEPTGEEREIEWVRDDADEEEE